MDKKQLREIYKAKRQALSNHDTVLLSQKLLDQMQRYDWSVIRYLHVYLPIEKYAEIDTWPFIRWIWTQYPRITTLISKSDFQSQNLTHYVLDKSTKLMVNKWGIPEPADDIMQVEVSQIDAVITPLLVLDMDGNRVGYGKGFYDRFFNQCREDVIKFGLSYFPPVNRISDVNPFDVPISVLFTPEETMYFNPSE